MADAVSALNTATKSQYHHYIPRFILRSFAHLKELSDGAKKKRGKNKTHVEQMVHCINLSGNDAEIDETPVAKTFGVIDMYRDFSNNTRQHQIEEQLSVLESRAGEVIGNIRKTFEVGNPDVWITRTQRDILRKFFFIMKYRGTTAYRRYFHKDAADYTEDDRELFLSYMKEKGFKSPVDVWFDNLKAILDLRMDARMEWIEKLKKRIYPPDAEWFINNTQQFYMAICTPEAAGDEFILTQNAYSMHEGPVSQSMDLQSGQMKMTAYTEFHLFAPISPKLIFVLRSFMLPSPIEDIDVETNEVRKAFFEASRVQHNFPEKFGSIFEDLPIAKARNSYSKTVNGEVVAVNGGMKGATDKFCLRFFPISEIHVGKINSLMFEESYKISAIVFNSKTSVRKSLEGYLKGVDAFNELDPVGDPRRVECIKKLGQALTLLEGPVDPSTSKSPPIYGPARPTLAVSTDKVFNLFSKNGNMASLYNDLSGSTALNPHDFDEARKLLFMRIKLDSSTRFLSHETREEMRRNFLNIYEKYPRQVIWIYLKRIRFMKLGGTEISSRNVIEDSNLPADKLEGPEDVVARERDRFRKDGFCRAMHYASMNGHMMKKPSYGLDGELTLDDNGIRRLHEEKYMVLGDQGSICDCGIPDLEKRAKELQALVKAQRLHEQSKWLLDSIFSVDEKIELATRTLVRPEFGKLAKNAVELEKVLFEMVYPIFGSRQNQQIEEEKEEENGQNCVIQ